MNIEEIMTTEIQCCNRNTSLNEIASQMWEYNCGAIPVIDDESKPVGMVTDRDIAMSCTLNHKAPWELEASTVIGNRELFTCSQDDSLETALAIMSDNKIRRLPVTDQDGYLVGILTIDDIIARSNSGKPEKALSYKNTMSTLKAVSFQH